MDIQVYSGRDAMEGKRLPKEIRTYDKLDELGISYQRADHPAVETMEDCELIGKALSTKVCKNLFLCNRQKTKFFLLMMPADVSFKTKELCAQINSARLSFAPDEFMEEYLDILPGAVSVMGLMNDVNGHVQLLIDEKVLAEETVGVHPCVNTSCIRMTIDNLINIFLPAVQHSFETVSLTGIV